MFLPVTTFGVHWLLLTIHADNFLPQIRPLCRLQANLSNLKVTVPSKERENGESYWEMDHRIEIWYQSTKLQAMITWEDGVSDLSNFEHCYNHANLGPNM